MANEPLVQIQIRGANVAIVEGELYAVTFPPPSATTWIAKCHLGKVRFIDQASGFVLCTRDTEPGAQAIVQPPGFAVAVHQWLVTRYNGSAEEDSVPVEAPSQLDPGFYSMREPTTGLYLYANDIDDLTARPKILALQPGHVDQAPLIFQVSR